MKTTIKTDCDMGWHRGDRTKMTINGSKYVAEVLEIKIDTAAEAYIYELELNLDWEQ